MKRPTWSLWPWFWKTFLNDKRGHWIVVTRLFLIHFFRRLRFAFRLREIWKWEYENCYSCGSNYRLPAEIRDDIWIKVNGRSEGCLCVDCFLQIASEKGIKIKEEHFIRIWVFNPERGGNYFDMIEDWQDRLKSSLEKQKEI